MEIVVIGDSPTTLGFKLAGIRSTSTPESSPDLPGLIRELAQKPEVGLVIINEKLAESVRGEINEIRSEKNQHLIIVEIPDPQGPLVRETDPILELIRRTLGAQIKT